MLPPGRRTGVVVSHTHWDRAWYLPFERFRVRLVRMVDRLLDLLDADADFRAFTLDGQAVLIEDCLEIRPELTREAEAMLGQIVEWADDGEKVGGPRWPGSRPPSRSPYR